MKSNTVKLVLLATVMAVSSTAFAGNKHKDKHQYSKQAKAVYGKVLDVKPLYRQVPVSHPVKECWSEPMTYPQRDHYYNNSAGNTLAGGLIGGVIGHQFGKGRGKDLATAVGAIVGSQLGHDSSRGHYDRPSYDRRYTQYEDRCETRNHVRYEEVIDGYRVNYRYKGNRYQTTMPYDPGDRIKLKLTVEPMF